MMVAGGSSRADVRRSARRERQCATTPTEARSKSLLGSSTRSPTTWTLLLAVTFSSRALDTHSGAGGGLLA
jgi:hypothetical protein